MKKIILITLTVLLNFTFQSCSEGILLEDIPEAQACCGGNEELPPPPNEKNVD
jgi:hypothetical protein